MAAAVIPDGGTRAAPRAGTSGREERSRLAPDVAIACYGGRHESAPFGGRDSLGASKRRGLRDDGWVTGSRADHLIMVEGISRMMAGKASRIATLMMSTNTNQPQPRKMSPMLTPLATPLST